VVKPCEKEEKKEQNILFLVLRAAFHGAFASYLLPFIFTTHFYFLFIQTNQQAYPSRQEFRKTRLNTTIAVPDCSV
jgi:hypothetical protein